MRTDEVAENKEQLQNTSNFWSYFENLEKSNVLLIFLLIFLFLIILAIFRWGIKYTRTGKNENTFPTSYKPKPSSPVNPAITDAAKSAVKTLPTEATKSITQEQPEQELESPSVHEEIEVFDENIFYMPYPKIDGSFYENNRLAAFVYGKSTFKFEIKIAEYSLATFSPISNDDVITDIFMDYEKTIKSVCEIEGNPTDLKKVIKPGMTKIVTVVPGMAQRSNQHWRLKQKAIIRFEYE
ncbi:MAG: hypothetical protein HC803_00550 [Saprospiraceae bacterium]|nr:hypothetical protein [Saprospiraceae bacterium]